MDRLLTKAVGWIDLHGLVLLIGYGTARTLMNLTYSTAVLTFDSTHLPVDNSLVFTISACVSLMLCAGIVAIIGSRHSSIVLRYSGAFSLCLLIAINICSGLNVFHYVPEWVIDIPISLLYGFGAVISNAAWLIPFAALGPRRCVISLSGGILLSSLACLGIGRLAVDAQCFALAGIGIICFMLFCMKNKTYSHDKARTSNDQLLTEKTSHQPIGVHGLLRELWSPLVIYVIATMAFGFATSFLSHNPLGETSLIRNLATIAGAAITMILAVIANRMFDLRQTFLTAFPILAIFLALLPFLGPSFNEIFCTLLVFLLEIINAAMLFLLIETARIRNVPIAAAVTSVMCISRAGLLISLIGGLALGTTAPLDELVRGLILVVIIIYLLLLGVITLTWSRHNSKQGISFMLSDDDISRAVDSQSNDYEGDFSKDIESNQSQNPEQTLDKRVQEIGCMYNLSPRETEVVILLAHGRSIPYISTELGLSANTVRTYAEEAYKKLGVHSKQELIDLFS